jgi:hypothetical protein
MQRTQAPVRVYYTVKAVGVGQRQWLYSGSGASVRTLGACLVLSQFYKYTVLYLFDTKGSKTNLSH